MENKYIKLLLEGSLKINKNTPLFISYPLICRPFVMNLKAYAEKLGVKDIYLDEKNPYEVYYTLKNSSLKEMENNPLFDSHIWDEYAKKKAAFLMLESEIPNLMEDIEASKVAKMADLKLKSKPVYREKQLKGEIPWCIAIVPNLLWAQKILPKSKKPLEDFWKVLADICMFKEGSPIKNWEKYLSTQKKLEDKLNALKITKLYYQNKLGTNLEITLGKNALWRSASSDKWLVNMPSYEIFTTPLYNGTSGIVYSSKPLIYNGQVISDFYIKFKEGKVTSCKAKCGNTILTELINSDKLMGYLGEVALVNYDSPISNTNLVFETTLIDENASCHLALGSGFPECIKNGQKMDKADLKKAGVNTASNHVDFMIGTKDLTIEAETVMGRITIMQDGNLII